MAETNIKEKKENKKKEKRRAGGLLEWCRECVLIKDAKIPRCLFCWFAGPFIGWSGCPRVSLLSWDSFSYLDLDSWRVFLSFRFLASQICRRECWGGIMYCWAVPRDWSATRLVFDLVFKFCRSAGFLVAGAVCPVLFGQTDCLSWLLSACLVLVSVLLRCLSKQSGQSVITFPLYFSFTLVWANHACAVLLSFGKI